MISAGGLPSSGAIDRKPAVESEGMEGAIQRQLRPALERVDEGLRNLEALKRLLRSDYQITTCESPLEALKLLPKTAFHVIVSDQRMPVTSPRRWPV